MCEVLVQEGGLLSVIFFVDFGDKNVRNMIFQKEIRELPRADLVGGSY